MASGPTRPNRTELRRRGSILRPAVAVLALYAVLLQAFLGGLLPMAEAVDGLCLNPHATAAAPAQAAPHDHAACCRTIEVIGDAPPSRAAVPILWPSIMEPRLVATAANPPCTRPLPGRIAAPRGPPGA